MSVEERAAPVTRPVVLPEPFNGEGDWHEWEYHFNNVAAVNNWTEGDKLKWLKVRLTGRAQVALQRLPADTQNSFAGTVTALQQRFDPPSRKTRYQAELQLRRKKRTESWADLADDLRTIAGKAYPDLSDAAKETLALNAYLAQLDNPQVAFGVKQKTPVDLDAAVTATMELESYLVMPPRAGPIPVATCDQDKQPDPAAVAAANVPTERLANIIEKLVDRVEKLETQQSSLSSSKTPPVRQREKFRRDIVCYRCERRGHIAHNCRNEGN